MPLLPRRSRTAKLRHDVPGLAAWVTWTRSDGLRMHGHHLLQGADPALGLGSEYEYTLALSPDEAVRLASLLGVRRQDQLVGALAARGPEIVARGEQRWLRDRLGPDATTLSTHRGW